MTTATTCEMTVSTCMIAGETACIADMMRGMTVAAMFCSVVIIDSIAGASSDIMVDAMPLMVSLKPSFVV